MEFDAVAAGELVVSRRARMSEGTYRGVSEQKKRWGEELRRTLFSDHILTACASASSKFSSSIFFLCASTLALNSFCSL